MRLLKYLFPELHLFLGRTTTIGARGCKGRRLTAKLWRENDPRTDRQRPRPETRRPKQAVGSQVHNAGRQCVHDRSFGRAGSRELDGAESSFLCNRLDRPELDGCTVEWLQDFRGWPAIRGSSVIDVAKQQKPTGRIIGG